MPTALSKAVGIKIYSVPFFDVSESRAVFYFRLSLAATNRFPLPSQLVYRHRGFFSLRFIGVNRR